MQSLLLLSEDDVVLAKCIFSDSPAEIVEMTMFSDCKRELLVTLIRAVLLKNISKRIKIE